jgi:type IV pilus assembly protein PilC
MFYPIAVVVVALIVTSILLIFVVPQFQDIFSSFGAELPAFTLFVIGISEFMQEAWWIIVGIIGISIYSYKEALIRSAAVRHFNDRLVLQLPVVGMILHKAAVARYARTLSTTFAAGVPLVDALDSAAGASGNVIYKNAITEIKAEVSSGNQMNWAMRNSKLFPDMVIQMVSIGEESGALDGMLEKVANIYEQEVDDAVDGLSSLLEPLIMGVLAVLVGGLIIAMYLPIFQLGSVV